MRRLGDKRGVLEARKSTAKRSVNKKPRKKKTTRSAARKGSQGSPGTDSLRESVMTFAARLIR